MIARPKRSRRQYAFIVLQIVEEVEKVWSWRQQDAKGQGAGLRVWNRDGADFLFSRIRRLCSERKTGAEGASESG